MRVFFCEGLSIQTQLNRHLVDKEQIPIVWYRGRTTHAPVDAVFSLFAILPRGTMHVSRRTGGTSFLPGAPPTSPVPCPRRRNVHSRLKSMGNTLTREAKDSPYGAGLNLELLRQMFLPPPDDSQHVRSRASTRMSISDESPVHDNPHSPPPPVLPSASAHPRPDVSRLII